MASSVAQYPCFSSAIKSSTSRFPKRNPSFIKATDDSSSSESQAQQDPVKLALAKAKAYKESLDQKPQISKQENGGLEQGKMDKIVGKETDKKEQRKISSIDFVGLGFADKKQGRGLPPGLAPISDPFPEGDFPEVEIIVGDTSRFENEKASISETSTQEEAQLYKPKVSTWGVFPRPNNISKTFGGGKTIRPGEVLEIPEAKAAKDARTREMVAAYKRRNSLNIDPKKKAQCEKALKEGDSLMDLGKLKQALPFYQEVMDKLEFQSELHGLAALQWSICQDSLNRSNDARVMYEKLLSHPAVDVRKKAKILMFGFQAMEMLKVKSPNASERKTGYQNYFEAFIDESKYNFRVNKDQDEDEDEDEDAVGQALPYVVFLLSPILMVLLIAVQKKLV